MRFASHTTSYSKAQITKGVQEFSYTPEWEFKYGDLKRFPEVDCALKARR